MSRPGKNRRKTDVLREKMRRENSLFQNLSRDLTSDLEVNEVLENTAIKIVDTIHAETITLYEVDPEGRICFSLVYYHKSLYGDSKEKKRAYEEKQNILLNTKLRAGTGIVGKVINTRKSLVIEDLSNNRDFCNKAKEVGFVAKSILCVPMIIKEQVVGAISVMNKFSGNGHFEKLDLELLEAVAGIAAVGLKNAKLCDDLRKSYFGLQIESDRIMRDIGERKIDVGKEEIFGTRQYVIDDTIGYGAFGVVYRAKEISKLGEFTVAIKVLREEMFTDPVQVKKIREEGRLVRKYLNGHQNIVSTYFTDVFAGSPYIVMECVEGISLGGLGWICEILDQKIPVAVIAGIIKDICNALAHAWNVEKEDGTPLKMVHRDVKPKNVLITGDGIPKLSDFGIAAEGGGRQNSLGAGLTGSPNYMSPEQASGNPVDVRSDVFSVGLVLYKLLAGHVPYHSETKEESLAKARRAAIPAPVISTFILKEEWTLVGPKVLSILKKALAKEPCDRFQSAALMSEVIQRDILSPLQATDIGVKNYLRDLIGKWKWKKTRDVQEYAEATGAVRYDAESIWDCRQ